MLPESRRLNDLDTVEPNYMDMQAKRMNRDVNNFAPELKENPKRPDTAQKWGVRE